MAVVLVTGGTGLLGKALQRLYPGCNWHFIGSEVDLRNQAATNELFESLKPTIVIHAAAVVGGLFRNLKYNKEMYRDNMLINLNVLNASVTYNVHRTISILSTCVFPGDKATFGVEDLHSGKPHPSNSGYAYAKRMIDTFSEIHGRDRFVCVVPCNLYGPDDNIDPETSHVIPSLIRKFIEAKDVVECVGTGTAKRQFLYVDDLASIIKVLVDKADVPVQPLIIAPETEVSIRELTTLISILCGGIKYRFDEDSTKDGLLRKYAVGAGGVTPLREGLEKTIAWFRQMV